MTRTCIWGLALLPLLLNPAAARTDALAVHGTPALPPGFPHWPHVRPDAPRGCTLRMAQAGTFDTLNPFTLRGRFVMGVWSWVYETLLLPAPDEVLVGYANLAEAVALDEATRTLRFTLRAGARWHDGQPVTAEDVVFSFATLGRHGRPFHRALLERLHTVAEDARTVRITLPPGDARRIALQIGGVHILPRHIWQGRDFGALTLETPVGSGPYRVVEVEAGQRVTFARNRSWWGDATAAGRGRHNMDRIELRYFRDRIAVFEALAAGRVDWMVENDARRWATGYDLPAVREGRLIRHTQRHGHITGMNGFAFNLRRDRFADARVREALALVMDFEWANAALFQGESERAGSFFLNSDLAATEAPDAAERALMAEVPGLFPPEAWHRAWQPPVSDGKGRDRALLERALALLAEAGWVPRAADGRLAHRDTGEVFQLAVLAQSNAQQALVGVWFRGLRRLGIAPRFEVLDAPSFTARLRANDFDLAYRFTIPPEWPGPEQRALWGSAGASNTTGFARPEMDLLLDRLEAAPDRASLVTTARVLDRALQWQWLVVPGRYDPVRRLAVSARFAPPPRQPRFGYGDDAWWCREAE
ncbi:MAG TPA: extracellular solute-binding protein [Roseococcus sp.]|jgi:microcin C transport system substrate-binding protein|nr:extracellular solute-binding protein [Roseococcus sp.]